MTEQAALLQAILADPADDAPRLIYADWLDEHEQGERAEFIRVQIELARLGPPRRQFDADIHSWAMHKGIASTALIQNGSDDPIQPGELIDVTLSGVSAKSRAKYYGLQVIDLRRSEYRGGVNETYVELQMGEWSRPWVGEGLYTREHELKLAHLEWWDSIAEALGSPGTLLFGNGDFGYGTEHRWTVRRGFISSLKMSWSDCERHLDAILREHPIEAVTLTTTPPLSFSTVASGTISNAGGHLSVSPRWPRIAFTLPTEPRTSYVGTPHGRAGWMEINGQRVPLTDWRVEINPEAIQEAAAMPDDEAANPGLRRETAAERARSMEFAGRHARRRRNRN